MVRKVVSFGYKHGAPASGPGVLILDVRRMFHNPYHNHSLKERDGRDERVQQYIRRTPNFQALYEHLLKCASTPGVDEVWVGCMGGRHRSVFVAELLADAFGVKAQHRDLGGHHG